MTAVEEQFGVPPEEVFAALLDAASYPEWLVGAQRIRHVEPTWPEPGSSFHHTVGVGPLRISDKTTVVRVDPSVRLELRAGIGPAGAARVVFTIVGAGDGRSVVTIDETPEAGVVRFLWGTLSRPLLALGVWGRNDVSLRQLRAMLER